MGELFTAGFWWPFQPHFASLRDAGGSCDVRVDLKFFKGLEIPNFGTSAKWAADKIPALYSGTQWLYKLSSRTGAGFHGEWGVWIMLLKVTNTLGCSHSLEHLFGGSGSGITTNITGKAGRYVPVLNCPVWDFVFSSGRWWGPGGATWQDLGICSSQGQRVEPVQVQEPSVQDGRFQRVQSL